MSVLCRLRGHRTVKKVQGPDEYARAECACAARFKARDGCFLLADFDIWERTHVVPLSFPNGYVGDVLVSGSCPDCGGFMQVRGDSEGRFWAGADVGAPYPNRCAGSCRPPQTDREHTP